MTVKFNFNEKKGERLKWIIIIIIIIFSEIFFFFFFEIEFQPMASTLDDNSLSLDQDTN